MDLRCVMIRSAALLALAACVSPAAIAKADTLRIGVNSLPPPRGNPYAAGSGSHWWTWTALFDAITLVDETGNVQPALAESWSNVDPNTWRFRIKEGLTFDNGEAFDAAAGAWAINYLRSDPAGKAFVASRFIDTITEAEAIDAHTLEIKTSTPDVILPSKISAIFMVAPKAWQDLGPDGYSAAPVGTGAFRVEDWGPEKVSFVARTDSWREPKEDRLETIALPDRQTRVLALLSNQIHVAVELSVDNISQIEAAGHSVNVSPSSSASAVQFISATRDTPFNDVRVRRALNYAVNKKAIVDAIYAGRAEVSGQGATPNAFGYDPSIKPYAYDPEKARQLLAEAGYSNGFSMVVETMVDSFAGDTDTLQQVAQDLARVGVTMDIKPVTTSEWVRKFIELDWDGPAFGMSFNAAPTMDANRFFGFNSCSKPKPYFCDEKITGVITGAERAFDVEARRALLQEALGFYHDQAHALYLVELIDITGVHRNLRGFRNLVRTFDYDNMEVSE